MARKTKEEANRTREQIIEAARVVFHRHGVSRSTMEQIAQEAGLTRGAVYWHFKDKTELFFAMREDVFCPLTARLDAILFAEGTADPLDAIEAALTELFRLLEESPVMRQMMDIMVLRCEYVDEFASVQEEADRPGLEFMAKVEKVYQRAAAQGYLSRGLALEPADLARDTWAFATGLLHVQLAGDFERKLGIDVQKMIKNHMALRRTGGTGDTNSA